MPVSYGLAFWRGDGQGGFRPPIALPAAGLNSFRPAVADENGDGAKDLIYPLGTVTVSSERIPDRVRAASVQVDRAPQMTSGIATPGNPFFHVGVIGGAANSLAVLGVSLGLLFTPQISGLVIDPSSLHPPDDVVRHVHDRLPSVARAGPSACQRARRSSVRPVYLQWAIADPGALSGAGFSTTPGRKIVFW